MLSENNKLQHIEGIRGLAAIIVVLHHFSLAFYPALNYGDLQQTHFRSGKVELFFAATPLNIFYNGGFAVCIFFILSGYVLSNSYHKTSNPTILVQYAVKRYFRLLIPVALTILIAYCFIKIDFMQNAGLGEVTKTNDWLIGAFDKDEGIKDVLKNMFVDVFFFNDNKYNPVLWTMTYELLGSFLIFGFLLIIHKLKYKLPFYILLILILFITQHHFYAAFILGVLLNKLVVQNGLGHNKILHYNFLSIILFSVGLLFSSYPLHQNVNDTIYGFITFRILKNYEFYHVLGSFLTMLVIVSSQKVQNLLSTPVWSFIGKISFSFYLLHFVILCSFTCFLFKISYPLIGYNWAVLISSIFTVPVIIIIAIYYYKWIDRTGIIVSEKILKIFFSKS